MLTISWPKAVIISLLLHCLLLLGIGWKAAGDTLAPNKEQISAMEVLLDPYEMGVASTPISDEAPPEDKPAVAPGSKTPEQQAANEKNAAPAKNKAAHAQSTEKNPQPLRMTNYNKEQLETALAKYNLILTLNSPIAIVYNDRGKIYYDKGDLDKAFADFSQAIELDPLLSSAYVGRGFIYINNNQWHHAQEDFTQAIAASPKNALAYYGRALCFMFNNDKRKAIDDFRSFIQYAPPEYKKLVQTSQQIIVDLEGQ